MITTKRDGRSTLVGCFFVVFMIMLFVATLAAAAAAIGDLDGSHDRPSSNTNPDDAHDYYQITPNELGGYEYALPMTDAESSPPVGTIRIEGDYMYVYGMTYNGSASAAVNKTSVSNWTKQNPITGWGCVALDKTKTSYQNPKGLIEEQLVTDFTRTYIGCTKMIVTPTISATAQVTTEMFSGCTALKQAYIETGHVIGKKMFANCSSLELVFIGPSVDTIVAPSASDGPFYGVKAGCKAYCVAATVPAGWNASWNSGLGSVAMNVDAKTLLP